MARAEARAAAEAAMQRATPDVSAQLKELYNACTAYSMDHGGQLPDELSKLYPIYVTDIKLLAKPGVAVTPKTLGQSIGFVIIKGVDPRTVDETIIMHEKAGPGQKRVQVLCSNGTVKTLTVDALATTLKAQQSK